MWKCDIWSVLYGCKLNVLEFWTVGTDGLSAVIYSDLYSLGEKALRSLSVHLVLTHFTSVFSNKKKVVIPPPDEKYDLCGNKKPRVEQEIILCGVNGPPAWPLQIIISWAGGKGHGSDGFITSRLLHHRGERGFIFAHFIFFLSHARHYYSLY